MYPYPRTRLMAVAVLIAVFSVLVLAQLIRLQLADHAALQQEGIGRRTRAWMMRPERGRIWDRNGVLLAGNEPRYEVWLNRREMITNTIMITIAPMLNLKPDDVRTALSTTQEYALLATDVPALVGERMISEAVPGLDVIAYWRRNYPEHALAAHVLGFYTAERKGYYGLEGFYDRRLAGEAVTVTQELDSWNNPLPLDVPPSMAAKPGADLVLTIDRTAQMIAEDELAQALETTGAEQGTIIVMDPRTGEILAMANAPAFDPNTYTETAGQDPDRFVNTAVSDLYEPGSVFKIVTLAAALDIGLVTPDTSYYDTACLEVGGRQLCNWDRKEHGQVTMINMVAQSLNVGAATLSTRMGAQEFYRYVTAFGFGRETGIDVQAEAVGQVRLPGSLDWYESDLGTNAFGQGLSATPIQMIAAIAAVANNGELVRPHVVKAIVDGEAMREAQIVKMGHAIRPETARTLTEVLVEALGREVPQAQVPGYRIAGKTGTSQIPIAGGYDDPWTIASFVGFGPASDPRLIILVRLDRPTISPWGADTAAPVFQRVASRLFAVMGIPPDESVVSDQ